MRLFKHPSFPDIETRCDHAPDECDHVAKGWVPLLTDEQQERFDEIELEVELTATPSRRAHQEQPVRVTG